MDIYFWLVAIGLGIPLWWFGFIATKRMRIGKNLEREAQAKRNLERHAREQAERAAAEQRAAQGATEPNAGSEDQTQERV